MERTASGSRMIVGVASEVVKRISTPLLALLALFAISAGARAACPTPGAHGDQDLKVDTPCTVPFGDYHYRVINVVTGGSLNFVEAPERAANKTTDFWANAIVIENGGAVIAGSTPYNPFGKLGGVLTIHLYGADDSKGDPANNPGQGVVCLTKACGIPQDVWTKNGNLWPGCGAGSNTPGKDCIPGLPTNVSDYFYQYGPLYGDEKCTDGSRWEKMRPETMMPGCKTANGEVGYFGYKVLAVSFGGRLQLFGYKGSCNNDFACNPKLTHGSWLRLRESIEPGNGVDNGHFIVDAPSNYNPENTRFSENDELVVTTTDYLPGHSEKFKVGCVNPPNGPCVPMKFTRTGAWVQEIKVDHAAQWPHNGNRYGGPDDDKPLSKRLPDRIKNNLDPQLVSSGVETRAAVALLTRSIRIVSAGDADSQAFPQSSPGAPCVNDDGKGPCYSFGGHLVIRQGFQRVQIQGVEFAQLGQGGRIGHYPVHFHMARKTPNDTFVKDSSINESMTRWIVLHSTQGVLLAGNVGYLSIGHGFYLEDGSETDNRLYGNIGVFARAAVSNVQNFRHVPGILAYNDTDRPGFPYRSDNEYPSAFWITNGWNDFIGNMATGAGTCGACYWFVPAENSSMVDVPGDLPPPENCPADGMHTYMKWSGYAGLQKHQCVTQKVDDKDMHFSVPSSFAGTAPIKSFYGNFCSTAMHSFQTTPDAPACNGIWASNQGKAPNILTGVKSVAPKPTPNVPNVSGEADDPYYPHYIGARSETRCPLAAVQIPGQPPQYDCSKATPCANGAPLEQCGVTVIDHYTSAFNWADGNVAAIWLRPKWYLLDNSVISDVQNAGLTFVTSGTYDRSAVVEGDWALALNTLFIGDTQPRNPYASNAGPFNQGGPLKSDLKCDGGDAPKNYCLNAKEGVSMPLINFFVNQRLFSIYDGPAYEDSSSYLDISHTTCGGVDCMYGNTPGIRKQNGASCYLPNAAIGWKQPNGFFYPPSFHSMNLFFDEVEIRHFVIDALWAPRTYLSNDGLIADEYCNPKDVSFKNYSDIDRQTELNDDDGSLTGLTNDATPKPTGTISVNPDQFFSAPVETPECLSNIGVHPSAKTCGITRLTLETATTSPYDYVTTAIIAGCGVDGPGKRNPGRCDDMTETVQKGDRVEKSIGRGGVWSQECTNPACYGVPLYRQFLTGNDGTNGQLRTGEWKTWVDDDKCDTPNPPDRLKCRFPFVRMGGQATYQRSTLTANHGTYYIDTTVPRDIQYGSAQTPAGEPFTDIVPCEFNSKGPCQPRSVNAFQGGQTYTVYFLYAKSGDHATQQTYQVYVGDGFNPGTDVHAVKVGLNTEPVTHVENEDWPVGWQVHYNDAVACPSHNQKCGILQVTVDFTKFDLSPTSKTNGLCQPHTFCNWSGNTCGCAFDVNDPRAQASSDPRRVVRECAHVCSQWAVKDLDFKGDETWGFSFTLPQGFAPDATLTNPSPHRPRPSVFPGPSASTSKPNWATKFMRTSTTPDSSTGICHYDKLPGSADCPQP
jgi:cell migration-inducing and hyaluronan-binding protein